MSQQPRRRRRGRGRRRSGSQQQKTPQPQQQDSASRQQTQQPSGGSRRRRGRRGRERAGDVSKSPASSEDLVRGIATERPATLTAPPDGQTLEQVIGDLQSEWGVPQYPQEYRITLKVADEKDRRAATRPAEAAEEEPPPVADDGSPRREKAPGMHSQAAGPTKRRGGRRRRRRGRGRGKGDGGADTTGDAS